MELLSYKQMFKFFFLSALKYYIDLEKGPGGMGLIIYAVFDLRANQSSILFLRMPLSWFYFPFL